MSLGVTTSPWPREAVRSGMREPGWMLRACGIGTVLAAALVRMTATHEPFPYWAVDPFRIDTPTAGITPAVSMVLSLAGLLGAAAALAGEARRGRGPRPWEAVLAAAGGAAALLHGVVIEGGSLDNLVAGAAWMSAIASALAVRVAARDARLAGLVAGGLLGVVAMVAGKGIVQLAVEHAETLRAYRENRAAFLAGQGWTEGSAMARAFERRLYQPEASGWFGLSNVYASVSAGLLVALSGLAWGVRRGGMKGDHGADRGGVRGAAAEREADGEVPVKPRAAMAFIAAGAALAGVALAMAKSKGGIGAAIIGAALLAAAWLAPRGLPKSRRAAAALAAAVPLAMMAMVAVRGAVGGRAGELSLLFRWFYMRGAARIFAEHPLLGVGPADFKEAYLIAKPPVSPEEVMSPHCMVWDYAATLGLGGLGWAGLMLAWTGMAGWSLVREWRGQSEGRREHGPAGVERRAARAVLLIAGVVTIGGAYLEAPATTVETAVMRLAALAAWVAIGVAVTWALAARARASAVALACAAIAAAAHAQIEVTAVWLGSAAWWAMLIALAAGMAESRPATCNPKEQTVADAAEQPRWSRVGAAATAGILAAAGVMGPAAAGVRRWERELRDTAAIAREVAGLRGVLHAVADGSLGGQGPSWSTLAAELSTRIGRGVSPTEEGVRRAALEWELGRMGEVLEGLRRAAAVQPAHFGTARAVSEVELAVFAAALELGNRARAGASAEEAAATIERYVGAYPRRAEAWGWLATVRAGVAEARGGDREWLGAAVEAWEKGAALDPYSLQYAPALARAYAKLGDEVKSRAWARRALELSELRRLDPLQQLQEGETAEMRRLAGV